MLQLPPTHLSYGTLSCCGTRRKLSILRVYAEIHYLWEEEMPKMSVAKEKVGSKSCTRGKGRKPPFQLWALYQVTGSSCLPLGKGKKHSHHSFQAKKYHCRGRSKHVSHFPLWESRGNLLGPRLGSDAKWRSIAIVDGKGRCRRSLIPGLGEQEFSD